MFDIRKGIKFIFPLSEELEERLGVLASRQKGKIVKFVVQYEALITNKWWPILEKAWCY